MTDKREETPDSGAAHPPGGRPMAPVVQLRDRRVAYRLLRRLNDFASVADLAEILGLEPAQLKQRIAAAHDADAANPELDLSEYEINECRAFAAAVRLMDDDERPNPSFWLERAETPRSRWLLEVLAELEARLGWVSWWTLLELDEGRPLEEVAVSEAERHKAMSAFLAGACSPDDVLEAYDSAGARGDPEL